MNKKIISKKLTPVTIRLTDEQHHGLADICASTGADNAFLVRAAVSALLDYVAANNGHLHLPLDFTTAWTDLDKILQTIETLPNSDSSSNNRSSTDSGNAAKAN